MPVLLKRIYDDADPADGLRVLVDRLWPRGMSKDVAAVDLWLKEIAPSTELRQWFGHEAERFEAFRRRYLDEIGPRPDAAAGVIEHLREGKTVTLLFATRSVEHNHAVVLAELLGEWARKAR